MANFDPFRFPGLRGEFSDAASLPNVAGSVNQTRLLSEGDTAWVVGVGFFVCVNATRGSAIWTLLNAAEAGAGGQVDFYVDGTAGSDLNPGTAAEPFASFTPVAASISLLPQNANYVVHVVDAGSAYNPTPLLNTLWPTTVKSIHVVGEVDTNLFTGTATGGTTLSLVDTGSGWTIDAFAGKFVEFTNGALNGWRRQIASNTADTLVFVEGPSGVTITAGMTFRIFEPSVVLQAPAASPPFVFIGADVENRSAQEDGGEAALRLINLRLDFSGGSNNYDFLGAVELYGVETTANVALRRLTRAGCSTLVQTSQQLVDALGLTTVVDYYGYGVNALLAAAAVAVGPGFCGHIAAEQLQGPALYGGTHRLLGARLTGGSNGAVMLTAHVGSVWMLGLSGGYGTVNIEPLNGTSFTGMVGIQTLVGALVDLEWGVDLDMGAGANCDGVQANSGGRVNVAATSSPRTTITATQYGVYARFGGQIFLDDSGSGITGTTANLAAGEGPATAASLAAVGNAIVGAAPADGSLVQRIA